MSDETRVAARVPKELLEQAKEAAKAKDITLSQAIRQCLRALVEGKGCKENSGGG